MESKDIVVSFEGVKVKEFRVYQIAEARGHFVLQDAFFARVVKSWPYEFDPGDPVSYSELDLMQYYTVRTALHEAIATKMSKGK